MACLFTVLYPLKMSIFGPAHEILVLIAYVQKAFCYIGQGKQIFEHNDLETDLIVCCGLHFSCSSLQKSSEQQTPVKNVKIFLTHQFEHKFWVLL